MKLAILRTPAATAIIPAAAILAAASALVLFVIMRVTGDVEPGSEVGTGFGIGAAVVLAAVMLYSMRRSMPAARQLGAARWYLDVHLWGGSLFIVLFLLHTSFRMPAGVLAGVLWALSLWVVATGAVGVLLQRYVPRILEPATSFEVHLRRIPDLVVQLRHRAESVARAAEPRVGTWYEEQLAAGMAAPRMVTAVLRGGTLRRRGTRDMELLRATLTAEGMAALDELREIHANKHELDVHFTLQRILRGWLYLHLPVAIALVGAVLLHIFFVIYF